MSSGGEKPMAAYGSTNPDPARIAASGVKRIVSMFPVNPEGEALYRRLQAMASCDAKDRPDLRCGEFEPVFLME